ncbi:MAG: hypothetical protein P4L73_07725 [Caulobacteraceae bacterium]|nr:hypothetical protein [Caulobacteraceae bacterium]
MSFGVIWAGLGFEAEFGGARASAKRSAGFLVRLRPDPPAADLGAPAAAGDDWKDF